MKIYAKTGAMDITLRSLAEEMRGDTAFYDRVAGVMIDIAFTAYDGEKQHIVERGPGDHVDIMFLGKWFRFTSDPDAIKREYQKE